MYALILKHAKGFSLPEIMVAMGIMGGISIITMKIVEDQSANETYLRALAEINKTVSLVETNINNPTKCYDMLYNKQRGNTSAGSAIGSLSVSAGGGTKYILEEGHSYPEFYIDTNGITLATSAYGSSVVDLVINFRVKQRALFGRRDSTNDLTITKRIPVVATLTGAKRVVTCGPALSLQTSIDAKKQACNTLGDLTVWDNTNHRCQLLGVSCAYGYVMYRMLALDDMRCQRIEDLIDTSASFDTSPIDCTGKPTFSIIKSGTKFKISCAP